MNKKIIIMAVVIIIAIVVIVIFRPKESNTSTETQLEENQITREEYNDNLTENIEEKLSNAGLEVMQRGSVRFKGLEGNEYLVIETGEEKEKTFEIYPINIREKIQLIGENVSDGKVTIDEETQGVLSGNILIINISDESLTTQIIDALN